MNDQNFIKNGSKTNIASIIYKFKLQIIYGKIEF